MQRSTSWSPMWVNTQLADWGRTSSLFVSQTMLSCGTVLPARSSRRTSVQATLCLFIKQGCRFPQVTRPSQVRLANNPGRPPNWPAMYSYDGSMILLIPDRQTDSLFVPLDKIVYISSTGQYIVGSTYIRYWLSGIVLGLIEPESHTVNNF